MLEDDARISIPCPACGHKSEKTVRWLKQSLTRRDYNVVMDDQLLRHALLGAPRSRLPRYRRVVPTIGGVVGFAVGLAAMLLVTIWWLVQMGAFASVLDFLLNQFLHRVF